MNEVLSNPGLHIPIPELPFSPCVEIGWRLMFSAWGNGFASEAAAKALEVAFEIIKLEEVVAFATVGNPCTNPDANFNARPQEKRRLPDYFSSPTLKSYPSLHYLVSLSHGRRRR